MSERLDLKQKFPGGTCPRLPFMIDLQAHYLDVTLGRVGVFAPPNLQHLVIG